MVRNDWLPITAVESWLKINEYIEYKLLSLTYKVLTTSQPADYLHNLISVQSTGLSALSSAMIEVFKYLRGVYSVSSTELLPRAPVSVLRGMTIS